MNATIMNIFNKLGGVDYKFYRKDEIIPNAKKIDYFVTKEGAKFKMGGYANLSIIGTFRDYHTGWFRVEADDVVLDLGANIGGFTIPSAMKCKRVYAVEPLFYPELEENISINNLSNIKILKYAMGIDNGETKLEYNKRKETAKTFSYGAIKNMINDQITFLKCDVEGYEWFINPEDLDGLRCIQMEVHPLMGPTEKYNPRLLPYIADNWNSMKLYNSGDHSTYILHAWKDK